MISPSTAPKSKKRWLRFSLRSLLLLVTLVALFCGLILRPTLEQRRVVDELRQAGATPLYDQNRNVLLESFLRTRNESWIDRRVGRDLMHTATGIVGHRNCDIQTTFRLAAQMPSIESIDLEHSDAEDKHLTALRNLRQLKELRVGASSFFTSNGIEYDRRQRVPHLTDLGLVHLEYLPLLECLSLDGRSSITDAGMVHVGKLSRLRSLDLMWTAISGAGLAHLQNLGALEELDLSGCREVDDDGMKYLAGLKSLRCLKLGRTNVTDAGLAALQSLESLAELDLSGCEVTDAGMAYLGTHKKLRRLCVHSAKVTDAGLRHLESIGEMDQLNLNDTGVTQQGVEETARRLHVKEWALPQEWQQKVRIPRGQSIYGVPATY